jgi:hypothetical protein
MVLEAPFWVVSLEGELLPPARSARTAVKICLARRRDEDHLVNRHVVGNGRDSETNHFTAPSFRTNAAFART